MFVRHVHDKVITEIAWPYGPTDMHVNTHTAHESPSLTLRRVVCIKIFADCTICFATREMSWIYLLDTVIYQNTL